MFYLSNSPSIINNTAAGRREVLPHAFNWLNPIGTQLYLFIHLE